MITQDDWHTIYEWAKDKEFPVKKAPTTKGYTNKDIYICGLKFVRKNVNIRRNLMTQRIIDTMEDSDILYATYAIFQGGTILTPHKDPNVYSDRYKRIQIPIKVPKGCYMIWDGSKVTWEEGVPQCYAVMDYIHEAHNPSNDTLEFLFLDVKMNTKVEL